MPKAWVTPTPIGTVLLPIEVSIPRHREKCTAIQSNTAVRAVHSHNSNVNVIFSPGDPVMLYCASRLGWTRAAGMALGRDEC